MIKHFYQKIKSVHTLHTYFYCTLFFSIFRDGIYSFKSNTMQLVASYFYALSFDFISIEKILYLLFGT